MKTKRLPHNADKHTPLRILQAQLEQARREGAIYLIARRVQTLRERGYFFYRLTLPEQKKLIAALFQARNGKTLPLASWLPRGYQILRLLTTIMSVMPGILVRATDRDIRLIKRAEEIFISEKDKWGSGQLPSLRRSARAIGVKLNKKSYRS